MFLIIHLFCDESNAISAQCIVKALKRLHLKKLNLSNTDAVEIHSDDITITLKECATLKEMYLSYNILDTHKNYQFNEQYAIP